MSGSGNWAINGGGTLILSNNTGANMSYTGRLVVNGGSTLQFDPSGTNQIPGLGGTPVSSAQWVILNNNSRLRFNVSSTAGTGFSGGTRGITVNSTGGIIDITGTNTVINTAGIFGSGTVTKDGTGLYSLRVANTFSGKWNVLQGTLEYGAPTNNAASLGTGSGADFVTIQDGATLRQTTTATSGTWAANQGITLAGTTHNINAASTMTVPGDITAGAGKTLNKLGTATLSIKNYRGGTLDVQAGVVKIIAGNGNAGTSAIGTLTTAASTRLDLNDSKLITQMPAGNWTGSAYDGVTGMVAAGRAPLAGVPQWNGTGIVTSQANAGASLKTTLAVATAGQVGKSTFGGQSVVSTDTLVMYTYNGDANLSGNVDADDYFIIDSNYNDNGVLFGFANGDFNYDGAINADDYVMIDAGFNGQGAPILPSASGDGLAGVTAVPEPGSIALLSLAALNCLGRRRRR